MRTERDYDTFNHVVHSTLTSSSTLLPQIVSTIVSNPSSIQPAIPERVRLMPMACSTCSHDYAALYAYSVSDDGGTNGY